jgi:hypothetical protein
MAVEISGYQNPIQQVTANRIWIRRMETVGWNCFGKVKISETGPERGTFKLDVGQDPGSDEDHMF